MKETTTPKTVEDLRKEAIEMLVECYKAFAKGERRMPREMWEIKRDTIYDLFTDNYKDRMAMAEELQAACLAVAPEVQD